MSITTAEQLEKLRACGQIVAKALRAMTTAVPPGVTTAELSEIGARILAENGAQSSPPLIYNFPGDVCISVNDEVVHGIPGPRTIQPGDLVKLDLAWSPRSASASARSSTPPLPPSAFLLSSSPPPPPSASSNI